MKSVPVIVGFLFATLSLSAQTTLRVLGISPHTEVAEKFGLELTFEENPNRCDPNTGLVPIVEQVRHINELLTAMGCKEQLVHLDVLSPASFPREKYLLEISDAQLFDKVMMTDLIRQCEYKDLYYKYPEKNFSAEYQQAVRALDHANNVAEMLADHSGMRIVRVLNIDDETRDVTGYKLVDDYLADLSESDRAKYMAILARLDSDGYVLENARQKKYSKDKVYNLWVTYELASK